MLQRLAFGSPAAPMILFVALLVIPGLDRPWGSFSFHFYIVSAASLLAAFACLILVLSARSLRETRILFLALSFFALGMVFAIHGLHTPGINLRRGYRRPGALAVAGDARGRCVRGTQRRLGAGID